MAGALLVNFDEPWVGTAAERIRVWGFGTPFSVHEREVAVAPEAEAPRCRTRTRAVVPLALHACAAGADDADPG